MTTNNAIRLLSLGSLMALSAAGLSGQASQAPASSLMAASVDSSTVQLPAIAAEMPPKPPKVTCTGDQLAISAENSTLGSVLAAVHSCTGIQIDIPERLAVSRTYEELGPGPVRQVLESLLSENDFNYVIGASDSNPEKVETVMLMARTSDSTNAASAHVELANTPARRAWLLTQKNGRAIATSGDESNAEPTDTFGSPAAEEAAAGQPSNPGANETPVSPELPAQMNAARITSNPVVPLDANPVSAQGKSTEEMIKDMQQLFNQRRQLQQSQGTGPQ